MQRLRLLQEKKEAQAKATRREIATLIGEQKIEKAKIKVEASELSAYPFRKILFLLAVVMYVHQCLHWPIVSQVIHEDIHVELLELLELYCELLLARFGLLDQK